ncbi:MAG TPA: lanthionine synthetase C family protein [Thermoanaerobaculia bacterium]|jgi:lantibiotic modifying enzyme|nr:lanthionine synthetase C family protein [Thermoanaerobaculia bacterium]
MWQSIADPEIRSRGWGLVQDIERCLVEYLSEGSGETPDSLLAGGDAGLALFFAYLGAAREEGSEDAAGRALDALGRSAQGLSQARLLPSLYSGFCGVGWVVEHLTRELFEGDVDLSAEIDEGLRRLLTDPGSVPYELISGLAGFGTYLVERLPHPDAVELLGRILDLLEASAEESEDGVTWYTTPEWLVPWQRELMPSGCYNLGVAHGVPGVLGFLAAAQREGLQDSRLERLAEGVVRWLLGRKLPGVEGSALPAFYVPGQEPEPARTAWCYGDLGVSAVLLSAARSFGRPEWEREAFDLARLAARRPFEAAKAIDTTLCHGTAGIAHLFNRFHQATGDPEMKEAALAWYRRTLDLRHPDEERFAGLLTWASPGPGEGIWQGEPGFLTGIAGTGLALLAALTEVEPAWDRVMLVATPSDPAPGQP